MAEQPQKTIKKKEWYKHGWGLVVAILLFPYFLVWYAWAKSKWSKNVKITVTVVVAVLVLPIVIGASMTPTTQQTTSSDTEQSQTSQPQNNNDQPAPEPEDYNLDIKYNIVSIMFTNNEDKDLMGCKVKLNDGYKTTVDILKSDSIIVPYSLFTKDDGTKFNYDEKQPKNVYISDCNGETSRYGYYTFK